MIQAVNKERSSIVITGGVACGKTQVCQWLAEGPLREEVAVFSADRAVAALLEDHEIQQTITSWMRAWGVSEEATRGWNKALLREVLFENSEFRVKVEELLHPLVLDRSRQWEASLDDTVKFALFEIPLLYEVEFPISRDLELVVAADPTTQIQRMMESRGLEENLARTIIHSQLPIASKIAKADVVVWNDSTPAVLQEQIQSLIAVWRPGLDD